MPGKYCSCTPRPISRDLGLPVKLVGVGEGMEDLQPFEVAAYVEGLPGG